MLRESADDRAVIVSSGRGVHEALAAAAMCRRGVGVGVVDMPSIDEELLLELYDSGKLICLRRAEQRLHLAELLQGAVPARGERHGTGSRHDRQHARPRTAGRSSFTRRRMRNWSRRSAFGVAKLAATVEQQLEGGAAMSVPAIHETDVEELDLPGPAAALGGLARGLPANHCSACVIRVAPGERCGRRTAIRTAKR